MGDVAAWHCSMLGAVWRAGEKAPGTNPGVKASVMLVGDSLLAYMPKPFDSAPESLVLHLTPHLRQQASSSVAHICTARDTLPCARALKTCARAVCRCPDTHERCFPLSWSHQIPPRCGLTVRGGSSALHPGVSCRVLQAGISPAGDLLPDVLRGPTFSGAGLADSSPTSAADFL